MLPEQPANRSPMVFDKSMGEDLQESKVNEIGNLRKECPCYTMAEILTTLSHGVELCGNVENVPNEVTNLTREISNQSLECGTWFFLLLIVKHKKRKNK